MLSFSEYNILKACLCKFKKLEINNLNRYPLIIIYTVLRKDSLELCICGLLDLFPITVYIGKGPVRNCILT